LTSIALRNLLSHKLRAALTTLAVVLGVMMVAGTYVLTDTISQSFDEIFTESNQGVDAVITPHEIVDQNNGSQPPFPASVLAKVRATEGVAQAAGAISDQQVAIIGTDGKRTGSGHAPSIGVSSGPDRFDPLTYVEGHKPLADDELVVDKQTADSEGFHIGDRVRVAAKLPARTYKLVGIATLGDVDSFGGASLAELTLPEAQRITGKEGKLDQIGVAADPGVTPSRLVANLKAQLPDSLDVETGTQNSESQAREVDSFIGILKTILLVFAGVALFVASFLIFNTFSITIAQRTREFAMLRTIGASRRQLLNSVIVEALAIGLLASAIGLLAGIAFAPVIASLFNAAGIDLPHNHTVIASRTVIVSFVLGISLTLLSALIPALRATRVSPVAGLREGATLSTPRERRLLSAVGAAIAVAGIAMIALGLAGALSPGELWVGLGAGAVFVGVALFSPRLVGPIAAVVGRPLERLRGVSGRIARENTVRNPGRTATTAAALMIGLALVSFVSIFAAGLKGTINDAIDQTITGDLIIGNTDGFSDIPVASEAAVAKIPGVEVVSPLRLAQAKIAGAGKGSLTLVDPATATKVLDLEWKQGSQRTLSSLGPNDAAIDEKWGKDNGLGVGDTFTTTTASDKQLSYRVTGTFTDHADFMGDYAASDVNAPAYDDGDTVTNLFLKLAPGADVAATRARIDAALKAGFPTAESQDRGQLKDQISSSLNTLLGVIYAMLALAVIVSLFGIVNTLALSIYERTRELGLLRAVGMSRRQVRRVVRYEAVITALIGALLGATLGVVFAVLISRPLADEGFTLKIPVGTLVLLLFLAMLAGVIAAIGPARRASRLDVLEALAYE
jgi:putative ABC transport system permease protein